MKLKFLNSLVIICFLSLIGYAQEEPVEPIDFHESFKEIKAFEDDGQYGFRTKDSIIIPAQYDEIQSFINGLAVVRKGASFGMVDQSGNLAIPVEYQALKGALQGMIPAQKEGKWGYLNNRNQVVIPFHFESADVFASEQIAAVKINGKWGFINKQGKMIIEPVYDKQKLFHSAPIQVQKDGLWGIIDAKGKTLLTIEYQSIKALDRYYFVTKNNKTGVLKNDFDILLPIEFDVIELTPSDNYILCKNGKCALTALEKALQASYYYDQIEARKNGLHRVRVDNKYGWIGKEGESVIPPVYEDSGQISGGGIEVKKNGKWGEIDKKGNEIAPFNKSIPRFKQTKIKRSNGKFGVSAEGKDLIPCEYNKIQKLNETSFIACKAGKCGILNYYNEIIIPFEYEQIFKPANEMLRFKKEGLYGFLNEKLKISYQAQFEKAEDFDFYGNAVVKENGKFGLAKTTGEFIIPTEYNQITSCGDLFYIEKEGLKGYIDVNGEVIIPIIHTKLMVADKYSRYISGEKNGLQGFYDRKGKVFIPFIYEKLGSYSIILPISIKQDGKYGFLSPSGEPLIPAIYDESSDYFSEDFASVRKGSDWGFVHKNGKQIIKPQFQEVKPFYKGVGLVKTSRGWGAIDKSGKILIKPEYETIKSVNPGFQVQKDGKMGIVNSQNEMILPVKYDAFGFISDQFIEASLNDNWGVLDYSGKLIVPFDYEGINQFVPSKLIRTVKNEKYGLWSTSGMQLTKNDFEEIQLRMDELIPAKKAGKWGFLDHQGNTKIDFIFDKVGPFGVSSITEATLDGKRGYIDTSGKFATD